MKKKIDPLFALSVIVLVLGLCALAFAYVPVESCAKAETVSAVIPSNTDFVIGTTTTAKYWPSATPLVGGSYKNSHIIGYFVKGLPKVSDFPSLSSPSQYEVVISFSGVINGANYVVSSSLLFTNNFGGQSIVAFQVDLTGSGDDLDLNIYTDHIFTGDAEYFNSFCNHSFASRFCVFDSSSDVTVSYVFKDNDVVVTSETMTDNFREFLTVVNDCISYSPVDFASYGDYLLNNQGGGDPDLQNKYDDLQKKYEDLLYQYSLVAPAGSATVNWGTAFRFWPLIADTTLPVTNTLYYEGKFKFGSGVTTKGYEKFFNVSAELDTASSAWYPSSATQGSYVCFSLPFNYSVTPNTTLSYTFNTPISTKMMLGVYDSERKTIYFKGFLNNVSSLSFSAFDYRTSNADDRIVFYGYVEDAQPVLKEYMVPTAVDVLHISISAGQNSYDAGFNAGKLSVEQQYNSQLSAAIENARQKGFAEAQKMFDNGNTDYSFFGLISAVIDAPIKALRGLLNFDILGVNMFSFVTSLFSLAVVLMIVKLLLGTRDVV